MDLWKDVAHGKKTEFHQAALQAWEDNLLTEDIPFSTVARWSTVDMQAQKWVKSFHTALTKAAKKTVHSYCDEDTELCGPSATDIAFAFRTMRGAL